MQERASQSLTQSSTYESKTVFTASMGVSSGFPSSLHFMDSSHIPSVDLQADSGVITLMKGLSSPCDLSAWRMMNFNGRDN